MTKSKKITLSASRDIPFNKLVLSQSNIRQIKAGVLIEELAEDIARRTLLASLTVRPVLDDGGAETSMFEIPAGGHRYRALELLVKQRRLNKTASVPCIVRTDGLAEEGNLAGLYVIRTGLPQSEPIGLGTVRAYKRLGSVERAFRSLKIVDLKVRPVHHRTEPRVRAHVFLCMLAHYVEWHMRRPAAVRRGAGAGCPLVTKYVITSGLARFADSATTDSGFPDFFHTEA